MAVRGDAGGNPTVTKGTLVAFRGHREAISRTFMFNPNDVSDTKNISWGSIEVPGASHPVYQFGAGGERLISFSLYLDGDRGRLGQNNSSVDYEIAPEYPVWKANLPKRLGQGKGLSVSDELQFYRSLIHPVQYGQSIIDVFPFICLFSMGELYKKIPVIVKKADWSINYWTPDMRPVRATVSIQLAEIRGRSITADEVLSLGGLVSQGVAGTGSTGGFGF